ncbi:fibrillarin-like rRNA/tRNA 2'-O-methyltransferase [Candidatus Woesearchaeota archaeon]|nr:fibrillarin-like rRNA/tRNA 2'-O-methyltransferase [Candidatus Woesearchaeota archaeon]
MRQARFDNIYELKTKRGVRLFTKSLYRSFRGFEEAIIKKDGVAYREVDPERSKLFAAVAKGASQIGIREGSSVLYLGASHGYTPSYVSDVIGEEGKVICVDFAPRVVRDLVFLCEKRENMLPLLKDCRHPETYQDYLPEKVDVVFQDVAQRDQVAIFLKNVRAYLKRGGYGLLALKARSVDVTMKPEAIFKDVFKELERQPDVTVVDKRELAPYEKDHILFVVKRR